MLGLPKYLVKKLVNWPPVPAMTIDNLYGYLDAIYQKRFIDGPIVEIGVATGGTTTNACRFLSRIGCQKKYYCVDTFDGFVDDQLATDHQLGLTTEHDALFSDNSLNRVKADLKKWGIDQNIEFVKSDICKAKPDDLPNNISVCLLDVDLRDPIFDGLHLLKDKMADGGIILVDDCKQGTSWVGATVGYNDFVVQEKLEPRYFMGFGVVEFASRDELKVSWQCQPTPILIQPNFYA